MFSKRNTLIFVVTAICAAMFYNPYFLLMRAVTDMHSGHPERFVAMLDIPSVKEGLKENFKNFIVSKNEKNNDYSNIMISSATDKMVDSLLTKENAEAFLKKTLTKTEKTDKPQKNDEKKIDFEGGYTGIDNFEIRVFNKEHPEDTIIKVYMVRTGFLGIGWKINKLDISGTFELLKKTAGDKKGTT